LIGICPLNPKIVYDRMEKKSVVCNSNKLNTEDNTVDDEHKIETENNNEPITHIKLNTINSEVLNELDTVKKQLAGAKPASAF
jgi:hypothetical protein